MFRFQFPGFGINWVRKILDSSSSPAFSVLHFLFSLMISPLYPSSRDGPVPSLTKLTEKTKMASYTLSLADTHMWHIPSWELWVPPPVAGMVWAIALFWLAAVPLLVLSLVVALTQSMTLFGLAAPYSSPDSPESSVYVLSLLLYPPSRPSPWAGPETAQYRPPSRLDQIRCLKTSLLAHYW